MTLAFSTIFPKGKPRLEGKQTLFIEKIWSSLLSENLIGVSLEDYEESMKEHVRLFGDPWDANKKGFVRPKIHTIRRDEMDRWKQGNKIHMAVRNRTPDRFQFAPVVTCSGIETIKIQWFNYRKGSLITVNENVLNDDQKLQLAINDGFESIKDFELWFNEDFTGKIIHWTPFRYDPRSIEVNDATIVKASEDVRKCDCWLKNESCKCQTK